LLVTDTHRQPGCRSVDERMQKCDAISRASFVTSRTSVSQGATKVGDLGVPEVPNDFGHDLPTIPAAHFLNAAAIRRLGDHPQTRK
jgi:hypothetical protein